ncbi:chemotaxis protein CheB [Actinomycetospora sp. NBRC 106375]|uniref:chemotaxis protein CheB n=1 Tax=Actinomycetospora sp. NBRC 106375 TaxID=3032207 RepID=UPI0024A5D168|nr:chemotaxis protein CheB [Actinomycetospora sp. NBRC 106375]GLZ48359.1 chemotaxis protein CheB [Actinomycetospora sp. NBRC 106375]
MSDLRVIGVGASAGGIEALLDLVSGLDTDLDAAVLVVVHQAPGTPSVLADLLAGRCALPVACARGDERLEPGRVLVAPPDGHLQVADGRVGVSRGPRESGHRPAIDVLFRSLALRAGPGATGVVLSGLLDDGAAGLRDIVRHGGTAVVQDPRDARYDGMPTAALHQVPQAVVCPARGIGAALAEIAGRAPSAAGRSSVGRAGDAVVSRGDEQAATDHDGPGSAAEQDGAVEGALAVALRALEDKMALARRVAASAEAVGAATVAARSRRSADEALRSARVLRHLLTGREEAADDAAGGTGTDDGSVR